MLPQHEEAKSPTSQLPKIKDNNIFQHHQFTITTQDPEQLSPLLNIYYGPIPPKTPISDPPRLRISIAENSGEQFSNTAGSSARSLVTIIGAFLLLCAVMLLFKLVVMKMSIGV